MEKENFFAKKRTFLFQQLLLDWGKHNFRDFPWRNELEDPYIILCTEILLQKTSAEKVLPIFSNFFELFPTVKVLADSNLDDVASVIKPLGLQNKKASALVNAARWVVQNGEITSSNLKVLKENVKGVSDYVTNAVSCFCFGEKVPLIDVNVKKILKLVFGVEKEIEIEMILGSCTENLRKSEVKNFYFALIDLGSAIRSNTKNLLEEKVAIIPVEEKSFEKILTRRVYGRFKHVDFKREVSYLLIYQKSPIKTITHLCKIKCKKTSDSVVNYSLNPILELQIPITLEKNDYPPVSYKYTKLLNVIRAFSYSDL